jgi:GT2 family glycosyltransferase
MEKVPKVSIVIPTMNRKDEVVECLRSVEKTNYPNYAVIVVDDATTDGTLEEIKRSFRDVRVIRNDENKGAAASRKIGLENSDGEYIMFLDSDTIVDDKAVEELVNGFAVFPEAGLVAPIIYFEERDRIFYAGAKISLLTSKAVFRELGRKDKGQFNKIEIIKNGHAPTAFMVKREAIHAAGGFDSTFYMGFEESDLAKRIEKLNYQIVFNPKAKVWHQDPTPKYKSKLSEFLFYICFRNEKIAYYTSKNRIRYMKRHANRINLSLFLTLFLPASLLIYSIKCVFSRRPAMLASIFKGSFDGLKSLFSPSA